MKVAAMNALSRVSLGREGAAPKFQVRFQRGAGHGWGVLDDPDQGRIDGSADGCGRGGQRVEMAAIGRSHPQEESAGQQVEEKGAGGDSAELGGSHMGEDERYAYFGGERSQRNPMDIRRPVCGLEEFYGGLLSQGCRYHAVCRSEILLTVQIQKRDIIGAVRIVSLR